MIEKLNDAERVYSDENAKYNYTPEQVGQKINELIEASNRQDRAIAYLMESKWSGFAALNEADYTYWAAARAELRDG